MQKLIDQKNSQQEKLTNYFIGLLLFLVASLLVTKVIIANHLVGSSEKLHNLDGQITKLESENEVMAENLRSEESLVFAEQKVSQMGFNKSPKFTYLPTGNSVAFGEIVTQIR